MAPSKSGKTLQWTNVTQGTNLIRRGWSRVLHPQQVKYLSCCNACKASEKITGDTCDNFYTLQLLQFHNDCGNTRQKGLCKLIDWLRNSVIKGGPQITEICFWRLGMMLLLRKPVTNGWLMFRFLKNFFSTGYYFKSIWCMKDKLDSLLVSLLQ